MGKKAVIARATATVTKVKREVMPAGYGRFLESLKERIRKAQLKAVLSVNADLIVLYWRIGREILLRQRREGWGAKVVDRLGHDLVKAFPGMSGLSPRNLLYMRALAEAYPDPTIVQQAAAQLPWGHNMVLLDRLKTKELRVWYGMAAVRFGWSRSVLALQIAAGAHKRHGKAVTNFKRTLPPERSDLVAQTLKDPYNFDFITLGPRARERELQRKLVAHIRQFLLELGVGFAYMGEEYHMEVDGKDYYMDLLFYHVRLRCYFIIDLKMGEFDPEHVGKMGFYLSALDDQLKHQDDQPSIGLLLCRGAKKLTVDYALRGTNKPIGVSAWNTKLVAELPKKLQRMLPSIERIEKELLKEGKKRD
ncbi:MAG TPA: PDDEXK nuclease domain-containing protein [Flavobacteriales bacterium]|nr:PDDEXK nuclease domain-containing protein [Flavobacteriales bacterium]